VADLEGGRAGSAPPPLGDGPTVTVLLKTVLYYGDRRRRYRQL